MPCALLLCLRPAAAYSPAPAPPRATRPPSLYRRKTGNSYARPLRKTFNAARRRQRTTPEATPAAVTVPAMPQNTAVSYAARMLRPLSRSPLKDNQPFYKIVVYLVHIIDIMRTCKSVK